MPDLKLATDPKDQIKIGHEMPVTSTPFRDDKAMNKTFDISQISPVMSSHQDMVTIAAEVSAAAATQASREFCQNAGTKDYEIQGWIFS